jgi:hypothetical protein
MVQYLAHGNPTPWFDVYRDAFCRLLRATTHDSFAAPVACLRCAHYMAAAQASRPGPYH